MTPTASAAAAKCRMRAARKPYSAVDRRVQSSKNARIALRIAPPRRRGARLAASRVTTPRNGPGVASSPYRTMYPMTIAR